MTMTGTPVLVRKGMTRKQRRLTLIGLALAVLGARGRRWCSTALNDNPSSSSTRRAEVVGEECRRLSARFRLGGLVEAGSA